ncbi:long-chain-fatty-acid-CoA-ligase [Fistulina hepatica ATCC 64428]|uniref:Long-chain-fatty-acid-CoA-ligase n=1 Tax=Fistulina hepatica ATCC 64428 TaxID=1128425 RepID=A0A0D7AL16_9AGAR|nr:long-chain-fatty-acid-CoA-ligase [Fistulina hepatica ATCC 64428]
MPSYLSTNKPGYFGVGAVDVDAATPTEGPVKRIAITADRLVTQPHEGIDTVYDMLTFATNKHGTRDAMGWRDVLNVHEEEKEITKTVGGKQVKEKRKWKYFELSGYRYYNYTQIQDFVLEIARGLVDLGISPDDIFNIYAQTSINWQLMFHACSAISTTIATAYDSLGESGLTHALNEPECVAVFTNADLVPVVAKVLADTPTVRIVIYDGEPTPALLEQLRNIREGMTVLSIDELRARGRDKPMETVTSRLPTREKMACIMYTSGSTGAPKGVCITHGNLVSAVGAVYVLLGHHLTIQDRYLAYLPLAHVLEYIVELIMFFVGMPIGYGRVKTLTDQSVRKCKGDITEFKPSIMVGVPTVWESIRKGILSKVNNGNKLKRGIFHGAYVAKKKNLPVLSTIAESAVFSNVKQATGGNLRVALSGGSSMSLETQEFIDTALMTLLQGYGMTESCGMCTILPPELMQMGVVGLPVPCIEVKLLDVEGNGYKANGNPPQGEICIRGESVTKGYYKRPDLNEDPTIFTKDGWFRTGDVGQWNPDGTLSIIDRIKNLVKLLNGEYVALERLEGVYKACNLLSNICVHASSGAKQPLAIIIPHESNLRHALESLSTNPDAPLAELCADPRVADIVLKECNALAKKNGFKPMELLQAVILTPDEWTPESGLVTAAQKIQRSKIAKAFEKEIKEVLRNQ